MQCPKCGSEDVSVSMQQVAGKTRKHGTGLGGKTNNAARASTAIMTLGMSNLVWKKSRGTEKVKYTHEKVGLCQACGADWVI